MKENTEELEAKLLAILNEPEETAAVVDAIEKTADGEEKELSEEARATLAALLEAGLPTPQEIVRDAKIAEQNAEVQRRRDEKMARKRARREALGKSKKRRRRR